MCAKAVKGGTIYLNCFFSVLLQFLSFSPKQIVEWSQKKCEYPIVFISTWLRGGLQDSIAPKQEKHKGKYLYLS